jgi:hypothetical protein
MVVTVTREEIFSVARQCARRAEFADFGRASGCSAWFNRPYCDHELLAHPDGKRIVATVEAAIARLAGRLAVDFAADVIELLERRGVIEAGPEENDRGHASPI